MKSKYPIYSLFALLLLVVGISSCSEEPGYQIDDVTEAVEEKQPISKEGKTYKKAAPKKRTSGLRMAPHDQTPGPSVLPDRRGQDLEP